MARILIIDDDRELTELLVEYLRPEGFEVATENDGENGLKRALGEAFDVLVLDIMLPGISGLELLRELRARSDTPVLMLTAKGDDVDRIVGLELGADDYLPKPCNPRELVARLRAILRRAGSGPGAARGVLRSGRLSLNPRTREVDINGLPVTLTSTEFNILAQLLAEAGAVVSKESLSERALNRKLTRYDRGIDMHISHLRRKLGGAVRIETVRGMGYQLAAE